MGFWVSNKYGYGTESNFVHRGNIEHEIEVWADPNIYILDYAYLKMRIFTEPLIFCIWSLINNLIDLKLI